MAVNQNWGTFYEYSEEQANCSGSKVSGIEVAALDYFDYVPGWLIGLGFQANYTFTDSKDDEAANDDIARENVLSAGSGLEGLSENAYSIIGFYDKDGFQARFAYNWRDNYLKYRSGPVIGNNGLTKHAQDYGQFDFSTSYDINETFTVSVKAINLSHKKIVEYADVCVTHIQYSGRRFQLDVKAKF